MQPRDIPLEPRATMRELLSGQAKLVGSRTKIGREDLGLTPGLISPWELREALGLRYGDPAFEEAKYMRASTGATDAGVAARWLFGSAFARTRQAQSSARPFVVSARVDGLDTRAAVEAIVEATRQPKATLVFFVHPHALNLACSDPKFAEVLKRADLVLPDGIGIQLAGRLLGSPLPANVNGTDLVPELLLELSAERIPVGLVGGSPGVAEAAGQSFERRSGAKVLGAWNGFGTPDDYRAMRDRIRAAAPCVVLVGMGSPIQERFALQELSDLPHVAVITVGGLFDFFSGAKRRAPQAVRELGLEWAWRLALEPRRLAKRYLLGNPQFLLRVMRQRVMGDAG